MSILSGFILFCAILLCSPTAFCQTSPILQEGIRQYKAENYEEAIDILDRARKENPRSSIPAFFLGLSYKQTMNYEKAYQHLRDSVTLSPRIKEALVELIDVSLETGRLQEAKKWIELAREQQIFPAKVAFLNGLALRKEGKYHDAAASFEKAKERHAPLGPSADFQIALCYMNMGKLKKAEERFRAVIARDPSSDLAGFARQYQDMAAERIFLERPIRFALGVFGQYDTNMVLKPVDDTLASEVTDTESLVMNTVFRADYVPRVKAPWLFSARYHFMSGIHQKHATTHDSFSNRISVTPGYVMGRYALSLPVSYSHAMVRNPSYKRYVGSLSAGATIQRFFNQEHILELFAGYRNREYFQPPSSVEEDRDSDSFLTSLSWVWLYKKDAFFNLKYEFGNENSEGTNWSNQGHHFSSNMIIPLSDTLKLQTSGNIFLQRYKETHTSLGDKRDDKIYQASLGFTWEVFKTMFFIPQYTRIRADSNMGIYDYERDVYSLGVEYRF